MPGPATGAGSPHSLWPVTPFVLWPCVTSAATMTKLSVAKVLCMVGVFFFMSSGSSSPVKVIEADLEKAHRSKKVSSLCNTFGGGVFSATCFNASSPAVRDKSQQVSSSGHISTDYPSAETLMMVGFFLTVFVEQSVSTFRRERPPFIDSETFNAGSDAGSDSEYESPFVGVGNRSHSSYPEPTAHTHGAGSRSRESGRPGPSRSLSSVFASSAHSVFEGSASGSQEEGERVVSSFVGVAIHETSVAVASGISMARSAVPSRDAAKLAVTVSAMIPVGIGLGSGIESARSVASSVASASLQGSAGGTFSFVTFSEISAKESEERSEQSSKVSFSVSGYAVSAGMVFLKW